MNAYTVTLRSDRDTKEITVRANSGDSARSEALEKAAEISKQAGAEYRVGRCDPA